MKCPNCGCENPEGAKFCCSCGTKIEVLKACSNSKCSAFGKHILPSDSRFCPTCGEKLVQVEVNKSKSLSRIIFSLQSKKKSDINGVEYVDMGGTVLWGMCNLGAKSPESLGDYYCWGEIELKDECTEENYLHKRVQTSFFGISTKNIYLPIGSNIAGTRYDVVTHLLGNPFMMPSKKHFEELKELCEWKLSSINGMRGWLVRSKKNYNELFFPASGYKYKQDIIGYGLEGHYPSADVSTNGLGWHWELYFDLPGDSSPNGFFFAGDACGFWPWGTNIRPIRQK